MASVKQKKAFKQVLSGTKITKAMVSAGYSVSTSRSTGKLTNSKGWQELMEQHLPDSLLAKKHKEGLNATSKTPQISGRDNKGAPEYEYVDEPDFSTRHKYLDTAYKLKGRYSSSEGGNKTLVLIVTGESANRYGATINASPEDNSLRPA
jgi:hypothetical protein